MVDSPGGSKKPLTPAKLLALSCAGLLVSLGMCGVGFANARYGAGAFLFIGLFGLIASLVSVLVGIVWGIIRMFSGGRER